MSSKPVEVLTHNLDSKFVLFLCIFLSNKFIYFLYYRIDFLDGFLTISGNSENESVPHYCFKSNANPKCCIS